MDDSAVLLLGLGLLAAALLLVVAELFIPSGGLIALGAGAAAIAGIVVLFRFDTVWGFIGIGLVMIGTPVTLNFALKIWPTTPVGKRMLMGEMTEERLEAKQTAEREARERRRALVGAEGETLSPLRPVGIVQIGGQRVKVTAVTDNHLKVRAI